jgi:hypothetical protein
MMFVRRDKILRNPFPHTKLTLVGSKLGEEDEHWSRVLMLEVQFTSVGWFGKASKSVNKKFYCSLGHLDYLNDLKWSSRGWRSFDGEKLPETDSEYYLHRFLDDAFYKIAQDTANEKQKTEDQKRAEEWRNKIKELDPNA